MSEFDLDLRAVEEQIDEDDDGDSGSRLVLDVLDGTTPPEEWIELVDDGNVLVLCVQGDVNELAAGFAREVTEAGGNLVHFRGFLLATPPDATVDTDRL